MTSTVYLNNTETQVENSNAASATWSNYVDIIEDVLPWLQLPTTLEQQTFSMDKLQLIVDATCQWAQKKIGQPIAPTAYYRRLSGWTGWNGAYLWLPYAPVLEIVSVTEWWGSSGPHYLAEQTPQHNIDGFTCDYRKGKLTRVFPGLVQKPWFPGNNNIEVRFVAGWNPIPADWKMATLEMIAHWWRNTQQTTRTQVRGGGVTAESVAAGAFGGVPLQIVSLLEGSQKFGIG